MADSPDTPEEPAMAGTTPSPRATAGPVPLLLLYTLARVVVIGVLAALVVLVMGWVGVEVPFLMALVFAVVLQLPVSWLVLGPLRRQVTDALADSGARRRAERDRLRSALSGDGDDQLS